MPYLMNDEDLQKQTNAGQISGPSPVSSGGGPQKPGAPGKSGQWTNLQTYMNANKDSASAMGEKVAGTADAAAQEASGKVQEFSSKIPTAVQGYSAEDLSKNFYSNPAAADKSAYQNIKTTGGYTGPKSSEEIGYGNAESAVKNATDKISNIQSESGRQAELGNIYGRPNYSQGARNLDNLLLQNDPNARTSTQGVAQRWSGLNNMLSGAKNTADTVIPQNINTASNNMTTANQAEQNYVNNLYSGLDTAAKEATAANASRVQGLQQRLAANQLTNKDFAQAGINRGEALYNLNPDSYWNFNNTQLSANDVASPEQRQQWAALQNLIGGTDNRITGTGTNVTPVGFNTEKFRADQSAAKKALEDMAKGKVYSPSSDSQLLTGGRGSTASLYDYLNSGKTMGDFIENNIGAIRQDYNDITDDMTNALKAAGYYNRLYPDTVVSTPTGPKFGGLK